MRYVRFVLLAGKLWICSCCQGWEVEGCNVNFTSTCFVIISNYFMVSINDINYCRGTCMLKIRRQCLMIIVHDKKFIWHHLKMHPNWNCIYCLENFLLLFWTNKQKKTCSRNSIIFLKDFSLTWNLILFCFATKKIFLFTDFPHIDD